MNSLSKQTSQKIMTCIVGDFSEYTLESSYLSAFRQLEIPVKVFEISHHSPDVNALAKNRYIHRLTINSLSLRKRFSVRLNLRLVDFIKQEQCGRVIFFNGFWIMPETIEILKSMDVETAVFFADNPLPGHYNNRPETMPVAACVDLFFVWSFNLRDKLHRQGISAARFLPFGWDKYMMPAAKSQTSQQQYNTVFIGGWSLEREEFLESLGAEIDLSIFGPDYWKDRTKKTGMINSLLKGGEKTGSDFADIVRSASVNLNILRNQHKIDGRPDGVIMRHFEVPGCGGFLLSTRTETALSLFEEGVAGAYFDTIEECADKVRFYERHPTLRDQIRVEAHNLVKKEYQYTHNVLRMNDLFQSL